VTVVVAQLTDSHLRAPGELTFGLDTGRALQDAVAAVVNAPVPVDAVLATGDLADRGDASEYEYFQECVAPIRVPIHAIPGNHDNAQVLAETMPGRAARTPEGDVSYVAEAGPLRLIMLDTTVVGADHGALTPARLRWLEAALSMQQRQPTLLAMHHPPFLTGMPRMDAINLRDAEALSELLKRNEQVVSIACGHVHRSIFATFAGRTASVAPSPAYAVCLDLHDASEIRIAAEAPSLHLHVWSPNGGPFGSIATHRVPISRCAW
jgi:3',5'-cyclic AMP phosphodiesterase CpdA